MKNKTLIIDLTSFALFMISLFGFLILTKNITLTTIDKQVGQILIAIPFYLFLFRERIRKTKKSRILLTLGIIGLVGTFLASPRFHIINLNYAYIFIPMMCILLLALVEWRLEWNNESIFKILLEK